MSFARIHVRRLTDAIPWHPEDVDDEELLERGPHQHADADDQAHPPRTRGTRSLRLKSEERIRRFDHDRSGRHQAGGQGKFGDVAAPIDEGIGIQMWSCTRRRSIGHVIRHNPLEARGPDFRDSGGKENERERGQNQLDRPRIFRAAGSGAASSFRAVRIR